MSVPAAAVGEAAARSPLIAGPTMSELADSDELRYRDEIEPIEDPQAVLAWIERKELVAKLEDALRRTGLRPEGTIVDLGAGSCWLSAIFARRPEVERVLAVEFSRRRLTELAPVAIAAIGARPEKIERRLADFYAHGIEAGCADMVVMDAAFHHAADPVRLAGVAFELLRPGGSFLLHREPTLALLRRSRPHGLEGEHGDFEHEYDAREYLGFLRAAGFEARKVPAATGFRSRWARARMRPPLSWINGVLGSSYTYVGRKPSSASAAS